MILKVKSFGKYRPTEIDWVIFDNVQDIRISYAHVFNDGRIKETSSDDISEFVDQEYMYFIFPTEGDKIISGENPTFCSILDIVFKNGSKKQVTINHLNKSYILNDEGKTIEKL